mgnify:CR=1 FL=1
MLFNSIEFLAFLPIVFILYWFAFGKNLRLQNLFVVVASYFFYGWWDWRFLILIAFTSFCSWGSGILIRDNVGEKKRNAKLFLVLNITLNLLILGIFKYYDYFVSSFAELFGLEYDQLLLKIILPVGISFYTFQALSYSIDVYRAKIEPTKDIIAFFAYVSFFPQLVAGPIERATNLLPQFQKPRQFDYENAVDGVRQMLWGFFKKIVVADNCAIYVDEIFGSYGTQSGSTLLLAAILFSIQIYGDFSGYSDIAIGCARLFGIQLMQNFRMPYFSRDIAEFWRRWHISLTTWFRDYIYIPLGGSRCSKAKIIRNTFIIYLISGFWHGANWTFIAWGGYNALLFFPLIITGKHRKYTNNVAEGRLLPSFKELFQMVGTFLLAVFGWIVFRAEGISQAWDYILHIFTKSLISIPHLPGKTLAFAAILFIVEWIQREKRHGLEFRKIQSHWIKYSCYVAILVLIFFFGAFNDTFIYFQF